MASIRERYVEQLEAKLKSLSLVEAAELVREIEEAFDVTAAAPTGGMMMTPDEADSAQEVEEKTEFDLILDEVPAYKKIKELLDKLATLRDAGFVIREIDNIFVELTRIDNRILQSQVSIDDLKIETREMLATLHESIV